MVQKFYRLVEFRYCGGGCGNLDCNEERQTLLFYGIEPLCKYEAQKLYNRESSLITYPDYIIAVELLPDWKRFNIQFGTRSGLKGIRKFKCEEVKAGSNADCHDGIPPNNKLLGILPNEL
jgi:hypothetical protein